MQMRLGKRAPRHDPRTLKMARYSTALPDPPLVCNLTDKITNLGPMLNNDLGDCTCAAIGHVVQAWTAEKGAQVILPDSDILAAYEGACGYVPGDPSTDQGGVELDVLNYYRKTGVGGHFLSAYMALQIQPSQSMKKSPHSKGLWGWLAAAEDETEKLFGRKKPVVRAMLPELERQLKQAVYYFGAVYIGVELPKTAEDQEIWDVVSLDGDGAPGSWGGHAVPIVAYDEQYFYVISWGTLMKVTPPFLAEYMSEGYPLLSKDILGPNGKSPQGFDLVALTNDLDEVTA